MSLQSASTLQAHVATTEHISLELGLPRAPSPDRHMESFTTANEGRVDVVTAPAEPPTPPPSMLSAVAVPLERVTDRHSTLRLRLPTPLRQLAGTPSCSAWEGRAHWLHDPADHVVT